MEQMVSSSDPFVGTAGLVGMTSEKRAALNAKADKFVNELAALNANAPEFGTKVDQLIYLGRKEIADAAGQTNRFLGRPESAIVQETGVGADLVQLRCTLEALDPGKRNDLLSRKKLFGLFPVGNTMRDYFGSFIAAQPHITAILTRLAAGKDALLKDNAAIDVERQNLRAGMERLEQMVHLSKALDARLEQKAGELVLSQPGKAGAIREQPLFYVRQRTQDLLTQLAVTVQTYQTLDFIKTNNAALVKGIDRASATTIAALRTAVTVSGALTNQQLVLGQILDVNQAAASMIDIAGQRLRAGTAAIDDQTVSAAHPLATLQQAFENIYVTMDSIDMVKAKALSSMQSTADMLAGEMQKSNGPAGGAERRTNRAEWDGGPGDLTSL